MFLCLASCTISPENGGMRPIHKAAFLGDFIIAAALLAIGILSAQGGSFALICQSSAAGYLTALLSFAIFMVKQQTVPDWYCVHQVQQKETI